MTDYTKLGGFGIERGAIKVASTKQTRKMTEVYVCQAGWATTRVNSAVELTKVMLKTGAITAFRKVVEMSLNVGGVETPLQNLVRITLAPSVISEVLIQEYLKNK